MGSDPKLIVAPSAQADIAAALKQIVEGFGMIIGAIASGAQTPSASSETEEYLSVKQLAKRITYSEQTVRNLKLAGEFVEGKHFFKSRGRVIFSWNAMRVWVENKRPAEAREIPLVRSRRYGHSS